MSKVREIKFRAWDKQCKTMTVPFNLGSVLAETGWDDDELMQYTGLKDKNGEEIFEGDVILDGYGDILRIEFDKGAFWFMRDKNNGYTYDWISKQEGSFQAQIIGNIYENPELIKN